MIDQLVPGLIPTHLTLRWELNERPRFSWGGAALRAADDTRRAYIAALKAADRHDFAALIAFAGS